MQLRHYGLFGLNSLRVKQIVNLTGDEFSVYDATGNIISLPSRRLTEKFIQLDDEDTHLSEILLVVNKHNRAAVEQRCPNECRIGYICDRQIGHGGAEICYLKTLPDERPVRL